MKLFAVLFVLCAMATAHAEENLKMYFKNEELTKIIEIYSKASGQKFIIDPAVRGKVSILLPGPVSVEEAFNHLSSALAMNSFGISKQGDTMVVRPARNIQRDYIEVSTEKPSLKPERMYTWVYNVKNQKAQDLNSDLRILVSKDGELVAHFNTNQLIITDWTSNINRVAELMKEVDKPLTPTTSKIVADAKKDREARTKAQASKKEDQKEN